MSVVRPFLEELTTAGGRFEVVTETVQGRVVKTFANRPRHLSEFMELARQHDDREFLVEGSDRMTFAATFERARRVAAGLRHHHGVEPGDRVGVLGANAIDWVVAYWAAAALDAVVVPFNAWWSAEELAFGLRDSGVGVLLSDGRRAASALEAGHDPDHLRVWGKSQPWAPAFEELVDSEPADLPGSQGRGEDEPALLFYTSGTTGRPKAAVVTHRNVVSNHLNVRAMMTAAAMASTADPSPKSQHVDLLVVPLFHTTANLAIMVPFVASGHKLVFMPQGRFDPEMAAHLIEREKVTRFGGVPTVVNRVMESGVSSRYDLSTIERIGFGGAPASPALVERISQVFPNARGRVSQAYGLTETSAVTTFNIGQDYLDHPGSVGIAAPTVELRIADPAGASRPPGEVGEILVRGSNVIPGYWNRSDADEEAFVEGFLRTGDAGYLDDDGFLHITDRLKDVVIRAGENVYCAEVEGVLEAHPGVVEAAIVGVPHSDLGEEVKAFVVVSDRDLVSDDLRSHVADHLAAFKVPSLWEFSPEPLPRNPAGKILKAVLRGSGSAAFNVGSTADSAL